MPQGRPGGLRGKHGELRVAAGSAAARGRTGQLPADVVERVPSQIPICDHASVKDGAVEMGEPVEQHRRRHALQRPVINRTGLDGLFELSLDYAAGTDLTAPVASDAPSIFTAVEEQLGLKLRSVRAPLDVLVVDRADKPAFD